MDAKWVQAPDHRESAPHYVRLPPGFPTPSSESLSWPEYRRVVQRWEMLHEQGHRVEP